MTTYFAPYSGDKPAVVNIKGHRVLILASTPDDAVVDLDRVGGNELRAIHVSDKEPAEFAQLAAEVQGGVVVSPPGVSIKNMITSLEAQLPWVQ